MLLWITQERTFDPGLERYVDIFSAAKVGKGMLS